MASNNNESATRIAEGDSIAESSDEEEDPIFEAVAEADTNGLKDILDHNPDCVNITDWYGETPLHKASKSGKVDAIKLLLDKGANIEHVNKDGDTPLHKASRYGRVDAIQLLLDKEANIEHADIAGRTPLHYASGSDKVDAIKLLLDKGANIGHVDSNGRTPLHFASLNGKVDAIKLLLDKGANIGHVDNDGNTPLHDAAFWGELEAVKVLTERGADIHITNKEGETPLLKAVNGERGSIVRYLINECKMDITQLDQETQLKITTLIGEISSDSASNSTSAKGADDNEEEMQQAYSLALREGKAQSSSVSIYVIGQQSAGKTCLVASLLGDKFEENAATQGADLEVCTIFASQWSRVEKKKIPKQLQKRYHCKLKVTAEIKITAERQQPVLKAQNKQQLLESLPELPEAVKADLEQAKTAVLIDEDGINAIIWDFAGQSVYYGLHSMFLKEDNVAMIVFDASQDLHEAAKGRSSLKDPYTQKSINPITTGCESVCYWLKSIHSICRKDGETVGAKSKFVPTVFLVATHIDLIGDGEAIARRRQEIIDQLFLALRGKPFAQHLAGIEDGLREALEKNCFFISNKVRDQKELDQLRALLAEASHYIVSREHPVVFLNIERRLLSLTKMVISIAEFHSIAKDSGFFAELQSAELKGALAHFHSKGTVLHFPQAELLKGIIVLSPDWLTKLFAYVIVAHPYKPGWDCDLQFDRLKNQGILEEDFVAYMVKKFNKEQEKFGLLLTTKQAIEFAQLFGFITEVNNNTYFLEEFYQPPASENKVFIVPPMLPLKLPDHAQVPKDSDSQARIVYFKFSDGFIPLMVYYQMLGACIDRNIKRGEDLCLIRRHIIKMVLGHDQLYYVSLCEVHDSMRLAISPDEDGTVTPQGLQERWKLIEYFNTKLMEIVKSFMPASDLPQRYIPCSLCHNLHLKLDSIRESDKPLRCAHGKLAKDYYSDLRQYQSVNEATMTAIGDVNLIFKKVPKMKHLVSYLKKVTDWEAFGYCLLPDEDEHSVKEIKIDKKAEGIKSCKMALYEKFLECGVKTWERVINALEESDNDDIAKQVKMQVVKDYAN